MLKKVGAVAVVGALSLGGYALLSHAAPKPMPFKAGRIVVTAREFSYEPKQFLAKAGDTTFTVRNDGAIDHDFTIEDTKSKTLTQANAFAAGTAIEVSAKLTAGAYSIYCSIPGHRDAGMSATLKVAP